MGLSSYLFLSTYMYVYKIGHESIIWEQQVDFLPCYLPPRSGSTAVSVILHAKLVDTEAGLLGKS